jgi:hypothetical protein
MLRRVLECLRVGLTEPVLGCPHANLPASIETFPNYSSFLAGLQVH